MSEEDKQEATMNKKTVAIDFDGVIHKYSEGWKDGEIYDEPVEGSFEAIHELYVRGYSVAIFSTREPEDMREWFGKWHRKKFPKREIVSPNFTKEKPPAIAYIDDRGIRFTNWTDILNYF